MYRCDICVRSFDTSRGLDIHQRRGPHKRQVEKLNEISREEKRDVKDVLHERNLDEKTDNITFVDMSTKINKDKKHIQSPAEDHVPASNDKQSNLVKIIRENMELIPDDWDSSKINSILNFISIAILANYQKEKYPISARKISDQMGYSQFQKCKTL